MENLTRNMTTVDLGEDEGEEVFRSKMDVWAHYCLAVYMTLMALVSVLLNLVVVVTICLRKRAMLPLDLYVLILALAGVCHSIGSHPIVAVAAYRGRWPLSQQACNIYGAFVFFMGTFDISTLAAIAVSRYIKMCWPTTGKRITNRVCLLTLLPVVGNALLWSCAPLAGWGRYGVEPFGLSCSLEWRVIPWSYTVGIFACCYGLPLLLMLFCYGSIVMSVRKASRRIKLLKTSMDTYVTKMTALMCLGFMVCWTPYALLSFFHMARLPVPLPLTVLPPVLAKSTTLCNPVIYFLSVKLFRHDMLSVLRGLLLPGRPDPTASSSQCSGKQPRTTAAHVPLLSSHPGELHEMGDVILTKNAHAKCENETYENHFELHELGHENNLMIENAQSTCVGLSEDVMVNKNAHAMCVNDVTENHFELHDLGHENNLVMENAQSTCVSEGYNNTSTEEPGEVNIAF